MGADHSVPYRAVFLDRDGVINDNVLNPATGKLEAPLTAADFTIIPGALPALRRLQSSGYLLFLVSNQPNVAKRKSSIADHDAIHAELVRQLTEQGIQFAAFYYCLHHPAGTVEGYSGACACRKPSPFFLLKAAHDFGIDLARSWMVGDRTTDILCGRAAGVHTLLVRTEGCSIDEGDDDAPDHRALKLSEAVDVICNLDAAVLQAL